MSESEAHLEPSIGSGAGASCPCSVPDDHPPSVEELFTLARASWGDLRLERAAFERHVVAVSSAGSAPERRYAADLYLACACAERASGALASFEALHANVIASAIARIDRASDFVQDVAQTLRMKLFVRDPPKIASYGGRAKLSTWVTTLATRCAMDHVSSRERASERATLVERIDANASPELAYVRARYKSELEEAIVAALGRLSPKDRGILRLHLGEGMSIDRLAIAYSVGRSTAARWLAAARERLLEDTLRHVRERLGGTTSEIRDLARAVESQLHVSIVRLLGVDGT